MCEIVCDNPIQSERLIFRLPQRNDLPAYTRYCESTRAKFVGGPYSNIAAFEKMSAMIGHWHLRGFGRFVFVEKATNKTIGHVGASQSDQTELPDFTWTIWDSDNEKKGFALEAAQAYKSYANGKLDFRSLIARIVPENTDSIRLAKKLGGVLNTDIPAPSKFPTAVSYEIDL